MPIKRAASVTEALVANAKGGSETTAVPAGAGLFSQRGLVTTSLRLPAETIEALRVAAFEERCSKSEIVRRALNAYLSRT
jgi:hypothetical protein